jgi:hypothetical protein
MKIGTSTIAINATRYCNPLITTKDSSPFWLACRAHGGHELRDVLLNDAIGMPDVVNDTFACMDGG